MCSEVGTSGLTDGRLEVRTVRVSGKMDYAP
jgi:hypothetical protein